MWVDYHFGLDFSSRYRPRVAALRQNDRFLGRFIITPTVNGMPIDLTKLQAKLQVEKPDRSQSIITGKIQDGKLWYTLDDTAAAQKGTVKFSVILTEIDTDGKWQSGEFTAEVE